MIIAGPDKFTHPVEEQPEVLRREAVQRPGREHVEQAQLQVLQRLLLARHHPENGNGNPDKQLIGNPAMSNE